jgi:lysozyme
VAVNYSDSLVGFVQGWEGLKLVPSGDPLVGGVVDVGYGHVIQRDEDRRPISAEEALELLNWDLSIDAETVNKMVACDLEQYEFDALLDFAFNLGTNALLHSTLLRRVNEGDFESVTAEFAKWNLAGGQVRKGLVKRRAAEIAMFANGDYSGRP